MTQQNATSTPILFNTTQAADKIGVDKKKLINALVDEKLVSRTGNRHYRANPALIRAGIAQSGDLKWTKPGITFLKKAYKPMLTA